MSGIKDYSTTQANNIDLNGIDTNEGMLPSNLNNAIRALMKNTREWFNDSEWVEYGDGDAAYTSAWVSTTQFTIASSVDISAIYHVGRRLKVLKADASYVYGSITATSNNGTLQTITATFDSGNLGASTNTLRIFIGILSKTNSSIPTEIIGTSNIANNAITTAKIADSQITVAKMTSNSVDSDQYVDGSIDLIHLSADSVDGTKIANDSINSEHYVDASIDSQHIADDQITTSKIPDSAITSAKIANGAIVDADINASAAISLSKLENLTTARALVSDGSGDVSVSAITSTELGYLDGVSSSIQDQIDAKGASNANLTAIGNLAKTDGNLIVGNGSTWVAESGATARTSLGLGTISTQASDNVSLTGGSITGLGEPSSNSDASTKSYVDQAVAGLRTRIIAECASTANVNISNALEAGDAIDGVTLVAGDRVLLKNQSTASQNGLYIAVANGAGAASRDPEHDTIAELSGGMIVVNQGSVNDNKIFLCTTNSTGSVGSTAITYTVVTPANSGTVTSIVTGTGIDGGTITSAGTISIDSTVATLTGTQTLTNKTITSPKINEDVAVTSTATELNLLDGSTAGTIANSKAVIYSAAGQVNGTTLAIAGTAITSTATELNLLDGVSGLVQADFTKLAAVDSTAAELNTLDAVSRGSIIYGNASAATAILTKGGAGTVLTSDGTDIAWSAVEAGIEWQSSIVTASTITVVAGRGYWINTTSNACTITLPGSASVGDELIFVDYARKWGTNAVTINQNSLKFQGFTSPNPIYNTSGQSVNLVYSGATQGWIPNSDDDVTNEVPQPVTTDFLVIAGGGGGVDWTAAGGGGAGGYRNSFNSETSGGGGSSETALGLVPGTQYTVTVGAGGAAGSYQQPGNAGVNSSISGTGITTITSIGGGCGKRNNSDTGTAGGSGGGGADIDGYHIGASGTANQGFAGGDATSPFNSSGGAGGGGASVVGTNATVNGGNGGNGLASSITGSAVTRGGGGGGGTYNGTAGNGGTGGGGNGANSAGEGSDNATAGGTNTGGGGGSTDQTARSGGSGVVILRLATTDYSGTTSGSPSVSTSGSDTILTFNASGSYTA